MGEKLAKEGVQSYASKLFDTMFLDDFGEGSKPNKRNYQDLNL